MKKFLLCVGIILISIGIGIVGYFLIQYLRVKYAKIEVTLVDNLEVEFRENKKVSDFIVSINGKISNDYKINTTKIGEKEVVVDFVNDDGIKVKYSYKINVVDKVAPIAWMGSSYTITKGNNSDFASKILCGDNEDNKPNCYIEGEYDYNKVGVYPLVFKAVDRSGNVLEQKFNLNVIEPKKSNTNQTKVKTYTYFEDAIKNYKTDKTKIGIDVSSWQGEIDFDKIKDAGVEFIIIRVGGTRGRNKEYFVDKYFERNITEANKRNIDVGIYFYSYADSSTKALEEAEWVLEQIKDYKVTLPIAFDWENWSSFNEYNLSFFGLTDMATTFLDRMKEAGYEGILYSSKTYLEKLWLSTEYETWLAHYVDKTNYGGSYRYWQMCDDGVIKGINGPVDIDVMYME